jgi:hypothetical protein
MRLTGCIDALLEPDDRDGYRLGLILVLLYAAIPPLEAMSQSFAAPFTVQDDARQFLFWMHQWHDPALFKGDPIADYFRAVTPLGFKALHWLLDQIGLAPFTANKLLPLPLFLISGVLAYRIAWIVRPVAAVAIAASWLTCFFLSLIDQTLLSAVPRAFAVPLLLWLLLAAMQRKTFSAVLACVAQGIFYPLTALVSAGILALSLLRWRDGRPSLSFDRAALLPVIACVAAIFVTLLPFALKTSGYGPIIDAETTAALPAFQSGGRSAFFLGGPLETYLCGARAGLLPVEWGCGEAYRQGFAGAPALALGLALFALGVPAALAVKAIRGSERPEAAFFAAVVAAGLFWFLAAHILLFALHLPSRYTQHPLRATAWIAAALLLAPMLIRAGQRFAAGAPIRAKALRAAMLVLASTFLILPLPLPPSPYANYVTGEHPKLYAYLLQSPKDAVIASPALEADNIPSLAKRAVLSAREYAIPYETGYAAPLIEKTRAVIRAVYTHDPAQLRGFIDRYHPTFLLIDRNAFTVAGIERAWWRLDYPEEADFAKDRLAAGTPFVLKTAAECTALTSKSLLLLTADCVVTRAGGNP